MSNAKPAARLTDEHTCPRTTAHVPHVGGPVVKGSSNVFINGLPAARVGDMAVCHGPTDSIATGSHTVFINRKPAARMGDRTGHGGVIVRGSSNVFIGDSSGHSIPDLPGIDMPVSIRTLLAAAVRGKPFCAICQAKG